jgi:hypothetical protein
MKMELLQLYLKKTVSNKLLDNSTSVHVTHIAMKLSGAAFYIVNKCISLFYFSWCG